MRKGKNHLHKIFGITGSCRIGIQAAGLTLHNGENAAVPVAARLHGVYLKVTKLLPRGDTIRAGMD